jgi:hypothetical protein
LALSPPAECNDGAGVLAWLLAALPPLPCTAARATGDRSLFLRQPRALAKLAKLVGGRYVRLALSDGVRHRPDVRCHVLFLPGLE